MPYNPEVDANIVISKQYHTMLKEIVSAKGQTLKGGLEMLIKEAYESVSSKSR